MAFEEQPERSQGLFTQEFQEHFLRVQARVVELGQARWLLGQSDGKRGFWSGPQLFFAIPAARVLRAVQLMLSVIYLAEAVVYLVYDLPYIVSIFALSGCLTFHSAYWTLRELRYPSWIGVPLAIQSIVIAAVAIIFREGLNLPYLHAVFVLPVVYMYLCSQVAFTFFTLLFFLLLASLLFFPFSGDTSALSIPLMDRCVYLFLYLFSAVGGGIYNRWMQRVHTDYLRLRDMLTELVTLQDEAVGVVGHALRTEQSNMLAVVGLARERPMSPQRLGEIMGVVELLGGNLRNVVDALENFRAAKSLASRMNPWVEEVAVQFKLNEQVVSRVKANLAMRDVRVEVNYSFDAATPSMVFGDCDALCVTIDRIFQEMLRGMLRPTSALYVSTLLLGGVRGDQFQVLLRFWCGDNSLAPQVSPGIEVEKRCYDSSYLPLGEPILMREGGGLQVLYKVALRQERALRAPLVQLHTPSYGLEQQGILQGVEQRLRKLHVLLVEDNPMNQRVMSLMFYDRVKGFTLAGTGEEALALYRPGLYDIILMDVRLPGMDGVEVARAIRSVEVTNGGNGPRVPILALSAFTPRGERERCLNAGMDDYLSKPFSNEQLFRTMVSLVQGEPAGE